MKRTAGSIKNKVTATELLEERAKCNFDKSQMIEQFYHEKWIHETFSAIAKDMNDYPELANTHKFYEMTPAEI